MSAKTDTLKDIFMDVAGEATLTERQQEDPSRDPVDADTQSLENQISFATRNDGLDDAVEGMDTN